MSYRQLDIKITKGIADGGIAQVRVYDMCKLYRIPAVRINKPGIEIKNRVGDHCVRLCQALSTHNYHSKQLNLTEKHAMNPGYFRPAEQPVRIIEIKLIYKYHYI